MEMKRYNTLSHLTMEQNRSCTVSFLQFTEVYLLLLQDMASHIEIQSVMAEVL